MNKIENKTNLPTIQEIIDYLKITKEEDWCIDRVRTEDGKGCLLSHLFDMGKDEKHSNEIIDYFEGCWANTYMFYGINDGEHPDYPQSTPKQRIITYLENLRDGKEKNINQLWDEMANHYINPNKNIL